MSSATASVRSATQSEEFDKLARLGLLARAVIYLLMGWLAILVASGDRNKEVDQRGALHEVARHTGGTVILWIMAAGLAGYALWRLKQAAFGVAGKEGKTLPRVQSLGRALIYAFFAYNCVHLLVTAHNRSQARQTEILTGDLMQSTAGRWLVAAVGVVVVGIAIFLMYEGVARKFREHLKEWEMSHAQYLVVVTLGVVGTTARGAVFALAGALVVDAAITYDPNKARGIDGALRSLANASLGPALLIVAAAGLIIFGLFGCAEARWERT